MNITFFIGNGFDLNIGLNTKYEDFYPDFINPKFNEKFEEISNDVSDKNMIEEWMRNDFEKDYRKEDMLWSNLEMALGEKLKDVKETEVEKFLDDKDKLDKSLIDYLESEQVRFLTKGNEEKISEEFVRSLLNFSSYLTEVGKDSILQTCTEFSNEEYKFCFVCFNYTNILDKIINITRERYSLLATHRYKGSPRNETLGSVVHVHGTITEGMILAVNDADQINNSVLRKNPLLLDNFIKKNMNDRLQHRRTENAQTIINNSHIICIFGMSLGETDKTWWKEIANWLIKSKSNKLVLFINGHEDELRNGLLWPRSRLDKFYKSKILNAENLNMDNSDYEELSGRIFISYNAEIFKFEGMVS